MNNPTHQWTRDEFFKSSFSDNNPQGCVGVAMRRGEMAVIDTKAEFSEDGVLEFGPQQFAAFRHLVVNGKFQTP